MRDLKRQMSRFPAQKSMLSKQLAPLSGGFHQGTLSLLIRLLYVRVIQVVFLVVSVFWHAPNAERTR